MTTTFGRFDPISYPRFPLNNITPFTYRDGLTFLEVLESLRNHINSVVIPGVNEQADILVTGYMAALQRLADEGNATIEALEGIYQQFHTDITNTQNSFIADVEARIDVINNKTGPVDIQHIVLTGNHDLVINPLWPNNQPIEYVVRQAGDGNYTVNLPANVSGEYTINDGVGSLTFFTLVPVGSGDWVIRQATTEIADIVTALQNQINTVSNEVDSKLDTERAITSGHIANLSTSLDSKTADLSALLDSKTANLSDSLASKVDKGSMWANVKDYGAKGDNATDDTDAIKAAIAAAGNGGRVFFPLGVYVVSDTLTMLNGQTWEGTNFNHDYEEPYSGIRSTHGGTVVTATSNSQLLHMRFQGPGWNVNNAVALSVSSSSVTMEYVSFRDYQTALIMQECWYASLNNIWFYQNAKAMYVNYCYNVDIHNIRIHADRGDGVAGMGIDMFDRSMISIHGGSIEGYQTGINVAPGGSVALFGVYFESKNVVKAIGIAVNGLRTNVFASGCQVYLTNHDAWIKCTQTLSGDTITAIGNKFKGGAAGVTTWAYWWGGGNGDIRLTAIGDTWRDVHASVGYCPKHIVGTGSIVSYPRDVPMNDRGHGFGALQLRGSLVLDAGSLFILGVESSNPYMGDVGNPRRLNVGATVYNSTLKKPVYWDGSVWRDAAGAAV